MQITKAGRQRVESPEYATELVRFRREIIASGAPVEVGRKMLCGRVCLALCEISNQSVRPPDFYEFFDANESAISQATDAALKLGAEQTEAVR